MTSHAARSVPGVVRRLASGFEWRHVKGVAIVRAFVAAWLVALGSVFLAYGYWGWGVFLYLAACLVAWLAYQMPRWKLALDAENGVGVAKRA